MSVAFSGCGSAASGSIRLHSLVPLFAFSAVVESHLFASVQMLAFPTKIFVTSSYLFDSIFCHFSFPCIPGIPWLNVFSSFRLVVLVSAALGQSVKLVSHLPRDFFPKKLSCLAQFVRRNGVTRTKNQNEKTKETP